MDVPKIRSELKCVVASDPCEIVCEIVCRQRATSIPVVKVSNVVYAGKPKTGIYATAR